MACPNVNNSPDANGTSMPDAARWTPLLLSAKSKQAVPSCVETPLQHDLKSPQKPAGSRPWLWSAWAHCAVGQIWPTAHISARHVLFAFSGGKPCFSSSIRSGSGLNHKLYEQQCNYHLQTGEIP